ncbi:MAG: NADH-quinone oxidoreductase subunit B family protein [Thermodesulfovibrionales bacterium]
MIRILCQILRTGIVSEEIPHDAGSRIEERGEGLDEAIGKHFRRSLTIRMVDAGSCNGCELEIQALTNAFYNCEQYGIHFTASPRFADMLLVTGPVTRNMETALRRTYNAMPPPKLVVAVGDCGCNGGIFGTSYASLGGVDRVLPVDVAIHGCPPAPADILRGIMQAVEKKREKKRETGE